MSMRSPDETTTRTSPSGVRTTIVFATSEGRSPSTAASRTAVSVRSWSSTSNPIPASVSAFSSAVAFTSVIVPSSLAGASMVAGRRGGRKRLQRPRAAADSDGMAVDAATPAAAAPPALARPRVLALPAEAVLGLLVGVSFAAALAARLGARDAVVPARRVHLSDARPRDRDDRAPERPRRHGRLPGDPRAAPRRAVLAGRRPGARLPADAGPARARRVARRDPGLRARPPRRPRPARLARRRRAGARLARTDVRVVDARRPDRVPADADRRADRRARARPADGAPPGPLPRRGRADDARARAVRRPAGDLPRGGVRRRARERAPRRAPLPADPRRARPPARREPRARPEADARLLRRHLRPRRGTRSGSCSGPATTR